MIVTINITGNKAKSNNAAVRNTEHISVPNGNQNKDINNLTTNDILSFVMITNSLSDTML